MSPGAPGARIGGLDALRGLAALGVLVCHIVAYWGALGFPDVVVSLSEVGAHGVDVFVVLSGFVLMLPLVAEGRSLNVAQFYGRRLWRILPAYWTALAFAAVLAIGPTWHLVVAQRATVWDVVVHALGLQTIFVSTLGSINGSLWSISLELSLYLVFPVLVVLLHRVGGASLLLASAALCVVVGFAGSLVQFDGPMAGFLGDGHTLPMRLVQFVAGMVLASVVMRAGGIRVTGRRRVAGLSVAFATVVIATVANVLEAPESLSMLLWALAGSALVWCFSLFSHTRAIRRLDVLGTRAYSFYLVHQPIVLLCAPVVLLLPGPPLLVLAYAGVACLLIVSVCAEILFRTVEQPSHRVAVRRFPHPVERTERVDRNSTDV